MIYWVRAGDTGPVKVGYTAADVLARVKILQCGSPLPLIILRTEEGGRNIEAALHDHYRAKHVRAEWFLLTQTDVEVDLLTLTPKPQQPQRQRPPRGDPGMRAILSVRGMTAKLARELGLSNGAIPQWRQVPAERLPEIERITGIPRWELRPDICPPPSQSNSAERAA